MPYGPEAHGEAIRYIVVVNHAPTETNLSITVTPFKEDGTTPSEAIRDALFQGFLDKLPLIPGVTVLSAVKRGEFSANVTVTP